MGRCTRLVIARRKQALDSQEAVDQGSLALANTSNQTDGDLEAFVGISEILCVGLVYDGDDERFGQETHQCP